MKLLAGVLTGLLVLAALMAVSVVTRRMPQGSDCTERIVILRGPHGQPVECVCIEGALATCFNPGP